MTKQKMEEFENLTKKLMEYIDREHNPHTTIIITTTSAELLSGEYAVTNKELRDW